MSLSINIVNLGISQLQLHASDQEVHWTVKEEDYDKSELELFIKFVNYEADTTPAPNTPPPITWTLYPYKYLSKLLNAGRKVKFESLSNEMRAFFAESIGK